MKEKHREWAKLSATRKSRPVESTRKTVRFRDLPGVDGLENACFLLMDRRGNLPPEIEERARDLSLQVFGITEAETKYVWPDEYFDHHPDSYEAYPFIVQAEAHERRFEAMKLPDDEKVKYLKNLGWDFGDERGEPLRSIRLFVRQAEAVSKGIAGQWPDLEATAEAKTFSQLEKEAKEWAARRRHS